MRRIGVLLPAAADDAVFQTRMAAFLGRLQQLGWADGRPRVGTRFHRLGRGFFVHGARHPFAGNLQETFP
jgi:hypothetical protein